MRLWDSARTGFRAGWRALPPGAGRRFLRTLGIGLAGVLALTVVLSLIAKAVLGGRDAGLETTLVLRVADWSWPPFHKAIWLEEPGGSTLLIPVVLLATWAAARLNHSLEAIAIAASFIGAKPILLLGRVVFDRPRPDLIAGGLASPTTESFPSGHTLQAVCFWGVIAVLWIRSSRSALERTLAVVLWLALVGTVALARLKMGTHWPSDLAAGAVFGIAWVAVIAWALRGASVGTGGPSGRVG